VTNEYKGKLTPEILLQDSTKLPGLGEYTKGAVLAFAFNIGTTFIETNIRTVFIHHHTELTGKKTRGKIEDKKLFPLIEQTLPIENPREWYYALMDYGAYLKQTHPNPSRKSKHHIKQSTFEGSNRQTRSRILKYILTGPKTETEILKHIGKTSHNISTNIKAMIKEGFIEKNGDIFRIK
jgi:A/G-specific adenine glycosylase